MSNNKSFKIIGEFDSFKAASEFAKNESRRINKIITLKRENNSWRLLVLEKETNIVNDKKAKVTKKTEEAPPISLSKSSKSRTWIAEELKMNPLIKNSKERHISILGYNRIGGDHYKLKKNITVKKDEYQSESFASRAEENILYEECYVCNGSGGSKKGCLKCHGSGCILKEGDDPL